MAKRTRPHRRDATAAALCAVSLLSATPALAQGGGIGLENVVGASRSDSPAIKLEDQKVLRSQGEAQQSSGVFDWNVYAQSGWERLYVPNVRNGVLTDSLHVSDSVHTMLGGSKLFRNGIQVQPGVSFYSFQSTTEGQSFGLTKPTPSLNMRIPLWRGLGENNQATANERAAGLASEGAGLNRDFVSGRAVHDAVQIYWRCLAAGQRRTVVQGNQQSADDYVETLRTLTRGGQVDQNFLDRAIASQSVERVALTRAAAEEEQCLEELGAAMGRAPGQAPASVTGAFPDMRNMNALVERLDEAKLAQLAVDNRSDLRAMEKIDAAQGQRLLGAEDTLDPNLDLYVDPRKVLLRVSRAVGQNAEEGQYKAALAGQNEARINRQQLETQVRRDVADALRNMRAALANWTALDASVAPLERAVADAKRQEDSGLLPHQEYQNARSELGQLRMAIVDAQLLYAASIAALRLATGTIETASATTPDALAAQFKAPPSL